MAAAVRCKRPGSLTWTSRSGSTRALAGRRVNGMEGTTIADEELIKRLQRLEHYNWRLKRLGIAAVAIVAALGGRFLWG